MKHFVIAVDRLINTCFGGWCGETLSSRAYREKRKVLNWCIDWVFARLRQQDHCRESYLWDKGNKDFPEEQEEQ